MTQGIYETSEIFNARNFFPPDFWKSRSMPEIQLRLFNSPKSRYDVIIGCDVLKSGFMLEHARNTVTWDGLTISLTLATKTLPSVTTSFSCAHTAWAVYTSTATTILQAKYDKFSPQDIVSKCVHLVMPQQDKLLQLLSKFSRLFSGSLGRYVNKKCSIQLKDPSTPSIFCNPYSVPLIHQKVSQQELDHLISKKVLRRIPKSEWAFPTFLIPKKDRRVRWISDFWRPNKLLCCPRYFLPNIPVIMQKRVSYKHITKLDISMGFYTFELDEEAQKYCVISFPFGLY